MVCYNTNHFMAQNYETEYYKDLMRKKLLPDRGISLWNVPEKLPDLYGRLKSTGWICFSSKPHRVNEHWVREFYVNLRIVDLSNPVITIRGKEVPLEAEKIIGVYGL